jgi:sporulation protein YlmC with PRC-barrel domain
MGGIGYGDGYLAGGYADDSDGAYPLADAPGYRNARPGYEIRILLASANILAHNGQQQGCEDVLDTTRAIYKIYVADMHARGLRPVFGPGRQQKEITAARPVTAGNAAYRSDELIDTAVRSIRNDGLGSIQDLVTNPKTGKIAYLVVARGGIFGFDKTYVPVPWDDFKITQGTKLLVLDTTTAIMQAAPAVNRNETYTAAQFEQESQKVDAYWTAHMPPTNVN